MDQKIVLLAVIFVLGLVFLGRGITGMVVSQSCCFPPNCDKENICESAAEDIRFNTPIFNTFFILMGIVTIGVGVVQTFKHRDDDFYSGK